MKRAVILLITALMAALLSVTTTSAPAHADTPPKVLWDGDANVSNVGDRAIVRWSKYGFVWISGKSGSHLTVTYKADTNTLIYHDTKLSGFKELNWRCKRVPTSRGIKAACKLPAAKSTGTVFVQIWPRLGDDYANTSALPKRFRGWFLADAGRDTFIGGPGADFVNGAKGGDLVYGNAGNDWLRGGPSWDRLYGGAGADRISQG